jgi:hypothetical protein
VLLVTTFSGDDEHVSVSCLLGIEQELAQSAVCLNLGPPVQVDTRIDGVMPAREFLSGFTIDRSQRRG